MDELGKMLANVTLIAVLFMLVFLFEGDPDVWDRLHDRAMQAATCTRG